MTIRSSPQPDLTPQAEADRQSRLEREAAALRENLRRRKQQVRGRAAAGDTRATESDGRFSVRNSQDC